MHSTEQRYHALTSLILSDEHSPAATFAKSEPSPRTRENIDQFVDKLVPFFPLPPVA